MGHGRQIVQRAGLQNFQFQQGLRLRRLRGQQRLQAAGEIALLQLAGANIDADRQLQPGG